MRVAITGRTWIRLYVMAVVLLGLVLIAASRGSAQRCWAGDTCTEGCVPYQWSMLFRIMKQFGRNRLTSGVWARALDEGDPLAHELIDRAVAALVLGIASAINLLDVGAVIIEGGLGIRLGQPYADQIAGRGCSPTSSFPSGLRRCRWPRARRPRRRDRRRPPGGGGLRGRIPPRGRGRNPASSRPSEASGGGPGGAPRGRPEAVAWPHRRPTGRLSR